MYLSEARENGRVDAGIPFSLLMIALVCSQNGI
jgi:hypothetical protein